MSAAYKGMGRWWDGVERLGSVLSFFSETVGPVVVPKELCMVLNHTTRQSSLSDNCHG